MTTLNHPSRLFAMFLVFSLISAVRLELVMGFKPACINEALDLSCALNHPSRKIAWMYKETFWRPYWQEIGSVSKNSISLSQIMPPKFKDVLKLFVSGSLGISSFGSDLSGMYACRKTNAQGQVSHDLFMVVGVECQKKICEGDDAFIGCGLLKYKNVLPNLKQISGIVWKQNGLTLVVLGPDMNMTYQNDKYPQVEAMPGEGVLRIRNASRNINGQKYTCVVHGEKGVTPRQYSVDVHVQKCPQKIRRACVGERVDLKCPYYPPLTKNNKNLRLEWYNGPIAIVTGDQDHAVHNDSSLVKANGTITIGPVEIFDSGPYSCKVLRDTVLLAEHRVTLIVTQCPRSTGPGDPGPNEPQETSKAPATNIIRMYWLVFFAVLMVFVLP